MDALNYDVIGVVASFSDIPTLLSCRLACKEFNKLMMSELHNRSLKISRKTLCVIFKQIHSLESVKRLCHIIDLSDVKANLFYQIIKYGSTEMLHWCTTKYNLSENKDFACLLFRNACGAGKLCIAKWLSHYFCIDVDPSFYNVNHAFLVALIGDHINILKWISDTWTVPLSYVRKFTLLQRACYKGNLSTIKWLVNKFNLNKTDIKESNYYAFKTACSKENIEMAKWFVNKFQLTPEEICENMTVFYLACENGDLEMVKWLSNVSEMTKERLDMNVFWGACESQNIELVTWMSDHFNITREDLIPDFPVFYYACEKGDLKIAKWLHNTFQLRKEDVLYEFTLFTMIQRGRDDIVNFIKSSFS